MTAKTIKFGIVVFLILSIYVAFRDENLIRSYFPMFSASVYTSAVLCALGLIFAFLMRSFVIGIASLVMAGVFPLMIRWMILYWPQARIHFHF